MLGCGDAVIGINPATDNVDDIVELLPTARRLATRLDIPTQSCVLAHVTTTLAAIERGAPVDLVFQSIAGTEAANRLSGSTLALLREARDAALSLESRHASATTSCISRPGRAARSRPMRITASTSRRWRRAPTRWRASSSRCWSTPWSASSARNISTTARRSSRAGLEDHFCGKLLGLPMGCDVCYTNHAEADQDDMDALLTLLGVAGVTFIMGVPGADDVMLNYQSTSFHDALYVRKVLGMRPAPEFEAWLQQVGIADDTGKLIDAARGIAGAGRGGDMNEVARPGLTWAALRRATPARIGLGRSGTGLPTAAHLEFQAAHARARDAVHARFDPEATAAAVRERGLVPVLLRSAAGDRAAYLRRPDLGRVLDPDRAAYWQHVRRCRPTSFS